MLILITSIVDYKDMQLTTLRSTIQRDITWFLMQAHMSSCHIRGIRILAVIMLSNFSSFRPKGKCLRLRINKFKYKDLKLRLKAS